MDLSRRAVLLGAAAAAVSGQPARSHRGMAVWFAHNVTVAANAGRTFGPDDVKRIVAECADHGIETLYWQPRYVGAAMYRSHVVARFDKRYEAMWRRGVPGFSVTAAHRVHAAALAGVLRRFCPYDTAAAEASRRGMRFIAQIQIFDLWFPILPDLHYARYPELQLTDRSGRFRLPFPCYAEAGAQEYLLAEIAELLQRGAGGISLDLYCHQVTRDALGNAGPRRWPDQMGATRADSFGFNAPLVRQFEARSGADPRAGSLDAVRWRAVHGEAFTSMLRRVKSLLGPKPLSVGSSVEGFVGLGGEAIGVGAEGFAEQSPACYLPLEWEKWLREGIAERIHVWTSPGQGVSDAEQMKRRAQGLVSLTVYPYYDRDLPRWQSQMEALRGGTLDGFRLQYHDDFVKGPQRWKLLPA